MNLWPGDPLPDWFEAYNAAKLALIKNLPVTSVVEIGVRTGYGAQLFHEAWPEASYVGFDVELHNPEEHAFGRAEVEKIGGKYVVLDTQTVTSLGMIADLVHIDGNHTEEGCLHDIYLAVGCSPKWILVDDMDSDPVIDAVCRSDLLFSGFKLVGTPKDLALITL